MSRSLQVLTDAESSVTTGFLAADVYYFRIEGLLSSAVGIQFGQQLRRDLSDAAAVSCFVDVSLSQGATFAARSAVTRALLAYRAQLSSITLLVGSGPHKTRQRALFATLGRPGSVTDSAGIFRAQLMEAVPSVRSKLPPTSGTMRIARSVRPAARSMRPRARTAG